VSKRPHNHLRPLALLNPDEIEVVRYYIKCEIGKVVRIWEQEEGFVQTYNNAIDKFPQDEAFRLMRALTGPEYRKNPLYEHLGKNEYSWKREGVTCHLLRLPEINDRVNPILERCGFNLARLVEYLGGERTMQPRLSEFRDTGRKVWHSSLIAIRCETAVQILDGAHRAVILASRGAPQIQCYVGYRRQSQNREPQDRTEQAPLDLTRFACEVCCQR